MTTNTEALTDEMIVKTAAKHFKGYAYEAKGIFVDFVREVVAQRTETAAPESERIAALQAERDEALAKVAEMRSALERLRHSYGLLLARKPVRDVEETLAEVDSALGVGGREGA